MTWQIERGGGEVGPGSRGSDLESILRWGPLGKERAVTIPKAKMQNVPRQQRRNLRF